MSATLNHEGTALKEQFKQFILTKGADIHHKKDGERIIQLTKDWNRAHPQNSTDMDTVRAMLRQHLRHERKRTTNVVRVGFFPGPLPVRQTFQSRYF